MELVNVVLKIWIHDIETTVWLFQQWWAYCVVPIVLYMFFLILKWTIITAPLWVVISIVTKGLNWISIKVKR